LLQAHIAALGKRQMMLRQWKRAALAFTLSTPNHVLSPMD
jgi:hypothetical protein